jgi:hypothetical protein
VKKLICILSILATIVYFGKISLAAEHPGTSTKEHPGTKAAEHKEHPGKTHEEEHPGEAEHPGEKTMLSAEQIIKGIKDHISKVTEANNGIFPISDPKEGKDLRLKLIKVHEDKVSYIKKDDAYFACTDFITADGLTKYDLDFWMKLNPKGGLEVYQTKIHKKDGIPRFTYKEDEIVDVEPAMAPEEHT